MFCIFFFTLFADLCYKFKIFKKNNFNIKEERIFISHVFILHFFRWLLKEQTVVDLSALSENNNSFVLSFWLPHSVAATGTRTWGVQKNSQVFLKFFEIVDLEIYHKIINHIYRIELDLENIFLKKIKKKHSKKIKYIPFLSKRSKLTFFHGLHQTLEIDSYQSFFPPPILIF